MMGKDIDFMKIFHEAYEQKEMSADEYLTEKLHRVFPYSLTFKKIKKGGDEWMINMKEEKLRALTSQKAQLVKARDNYPKNSQDYRTINAVIDEHDKQIKELLGD